MRHFKPYILCVFNFFHIMTLECHFICLLQLLLIKNISLFKVCNKLKRKIIFSRQSNIHKILIFILPIKFTSEEL